MSEGLAGIPTSAAFECNKTRRRPLLRASFRLALADSAGYRIDDTRVVELALLEPENALCAADVLPLFTGDPRCTGLGVPEGQEAPFALRIDLLNWWAKKSSNGFERHSGAHIQEALWPKGGRHLRKNFLSGATKYEDAQHADREKDTLVHAG